MCLNVLHHFGDREIQDKAVSKMNSVIGIFEIYRDKIVIIEKYFSEIKEYKSHRQN